MTFATGVSFMELIILVTDTFSKLENLSQYLAFTT
jgi:hypothetical protein